METLQWVHGSRTVVNPEHPVRPIQHARLQWVHGSRTVVNYELADFLKATRKASMGPRFENRG